MKSQVLISVILPVYNAEKYLDECVQSICSQSFQDFEILLIDDNSTDNSLNECMKYAEKDDRVRFFHNENNKGPGECRNIGIRNAKGRYLTFVDADDIITQDYLKVLYDIAEKTQSMVVVCECEIFTSGRITPRIRKNYEDFILLNNDDSDKYNNTYGNAPWRRLIQRDFIIGNQLFFGNAKRGEDAAWNSLCKWIMPSYVYIPEKMYFYRKGHESLMTQDNRSEYLFEQDVINYTYMYEYMHKCSILFYRASVVYKQLSTRQHLLKQIFRIKIKARERHSYYRLLCGMDFPLSLENSFKALSFRNKIHSFAYNKSIPYFIRYTLTHFLSFIKR